MEKRVFFNDLTLVESTDENRARLCDIYCLIKALGEASGRRIRACYCENLAELVKRCEPLPKGTFFYTFFRAPYIDEEFGGAKIERYVSAQFFLTIGDKCIQCPDMGNAVLAHTLTLGFPSSDFWKKIKYIIEDRGTSPAQKYETLCLTQEAHVGDNAVMDWLNRNFKSEPKKCRIPSGDKTPPHFRDDHGIDVLREFAKRIYESPYVLMVVNSTEWHPYQTTFVSGKQGFENGIIEICLYWDDRGLGMVVQTTGENAYQTCAIAKQLALEYGGESDVSYIDQYVCRRSGPIHNNEGGQ